MQEAAEELDETSPKRAYGNKQIGEVIGRRAARPRTRVMFERQVWERTIGEAGATNPCHTLRRRRCRMARARRDHDGGSGSTKSSIRRSGDGAPLEVFFAPAARRSIRTPTACRQATNPNAAEAFLNWCLSEEGQTS